jgi:hypothetical protein
LVGPSFPHALSGSATKLWTDSPQGFGRMRPSAHPSFGGNPGGLGTGPPIKTFGGDAFKSNLIAEFLYAAVATELLGFEIRVSDFVLRKSN